jgi:hypothetical protein
MSDDDKGHFLFKYFDQLHRFEKAAKAKEERAAQDEGGGASDDRPVVYSEHPTAAMTEAEAKVMLILVSCANEHGVAYPSARAIARQTGLTPAAVKRARKSLASKGIIEVVGGERGGRQKSLVCRLLMAEAAANNQDALKGDSTRTLWESGKGAPPAMERVRVESPKGCASSQERVRARIPEHPTQHLGEQSTELPKVAGRYSSAVVGVGLGGGREHQQQPRPTPDELNAYLKANGGLGRASDVAGVLNRLGAHPAAVKELKNCQNLTASQVVATYRQVCRSERVKDKTAVTLHRLGYRPEHNAGRSAFPHAAAQAVAERESRAI